MKDQALADSISDRKLLRFVESMLVKHLTMRVFFFKHLCKFLRNIFIIGDHKLDGSFCVSQSSDRIYPWCNVERNLTRSQSSCDRHAKTEKGP